MKTTIGLSIDSDLVLKLRRAAQEEHVTLSAYCNGLFRDDINAKEESKEGEQHGNPAD